MSPRPRSPLWLIVLALASEEPMHPYRMHALIKARGKDEVVNVAQRNSVNQTISALCRAGLLAVRETSRHEKRPERTTYESTPAGREALAQWVRTGLSTPAREFPEFPAVLSVLFPVGSARALKDLLAQRMDALELRLKNHEKPIPVPRLFLIEDEYVAAMLRAEIAWLRKIIADIDAKKLEFPTIEEMIGLAGLDGGPSKQAVRRMKGEIGKRRKRR